ncbi:mannose-binding protein A-like [Palaemon carinicauda]|uniref:mannose-binding protein A-like n=1 Tax=Palaemon carinicauda TaxID=392227 RepID=UPI0035B68A34
MLRFATKVLLLILLLLPMSFSDDIQLIMNKEDYCLQTTFVAVFEKMSKFRCSAVCLQMKLNCVGFCFNKTSGDCQMFSLGDDSDTLSFVQAPGVNIYFDKSKEGILQNKKESIFSNTAMTFSDAKTHCSRYGALVFAPKTTLERLWAIPFALPYLWVGITDEQTEGVFRDVNTGEIVTISRLAWLIGDPNGFDKENCVGLTLGGFLVDIDCNSWHRVLCVKKFSLM